MYAGTLRQDKPPCDASASVTTGLKCAPEMGPKVGISATSAAPVAIVFARSAIATLPPARRSPMMPDPTTAASNRPVPTASATMRRDNGIVLYEQHAGPQHDLAAAGLVARMKPLKILPSISGAIAS